MNVEPISRLQLESALPPGVQPLGQSVYRVTSISRPDTSHQVDVALLQCACEHATKGRSRQAALRGLGVPPYRAWCGHLRRAVAYDGLVLRFVAEQKV